MTPAPTVYTANEILSEQTLSRPNRVPAVPRPPRRKVRRVRSVRPTRLLGNIVLDAKSTGMMLIVK